MALALPASAHAAPKPFFDVREQAREVTPPAATRALERRLGDQAVVDVDPVTRTPRVLARLDGALSAPAAGAPADVALRYVRANLAALGLSERDLDTLRPPETDTVAGITTVRWRQAVDGIAAADSELRVNLDEDGRVLNVLGSPAPGLDASTTPTLTAGEAVRVVQDDVGVHRALTRQGGVRAVTYDDGTTAKLTLYTGRLAWRVTYHAGADAVYDVMVDAETGKLLRRANLVKSAVMARVFERHPGDGTTHDVDLSPWLEPGAQRLFGRYVHAYVDPPDDNTADPADEVAPAVRDFVPFPCAGTTPCAWSGSGNTWTTNLQQNAIQAFYFANRFREHLATLGFSEFQDDDRLVLHASDGITADPVQTDNAYMYTPPRSSPESPLMQLQLWNHPSLRNINSGDDAAIVYHEYAHGLTSRRVTDPAGVQALNLPQAGAMGEGWSDYYAMDFLVGAYPTLDSGLAGEVHMGGYVGRAIRAQALDCPVGAPASRCSGFGTAGAGGFTYGDFGRIWSYPEVHFDGEIWAQTMWDVRGALGVAEARRVTTGALQLMPVEPTFLEARDAMLQLASGDEQRRALWTVFARRGMGSNASTTDSWDTEPREGFANPLATATPTPAPTVTPGPQDPAPVPTAVPTIQPTPVPTVAPTPAPVFTLSASGKRTIKVRARCPVACPVRAELTVDARTAKRLGTARSVGSYRRTVRAGTTTFTVNLSSKVKRALVRRNVKSFKATLRVRSGSVTTSRKVTVRR